MIKEKYNILKKKFLTLPTFEEVNPEFDLHKIENHDNLLKELVVRFLEVFEKQIDHINTIIQPSPDSFIELYECKAFNDTEQKEIIEVFRKLMHSYRFLQESLIDQTKRSESIKFSFKTWTELKPKIASFFQKQKICWNKQIEKDEIGGYLG